MPATYRITLKGWDRHYGAGHVLDSAKFEVRRPSKKADKEAVERLDDMMRSHPPQSSDRSAFAWAEVSDSHGYTTTLAKYTNDGGKWVGAARPELTSNPVETIQIVHDPEGGDGLFDGVFEVDAIQRFLSDMSGSAAPGASPPAREDKIHIFVEARLEDLGLPLPGEAMGWVRVGEVKPYIYQVQARIGQVSINWQDAARNVLENLLGQPPPRGKVLELPEYWDDVDDMAARLKESPPALDLARMFPAIEVHRPDVVPPKRVEWGYHAAYEARYEIEEYLWKVENAFGEAIDNAAEQLYEYARSILTDQPIEAADLPAEPGFGPTETPLAMNADWEASARVAYRGRLTGGQPIEHTLETRADEERKPVIDSALANARRRSGTIERDPEGIRSLMAQLEEPERTQLQQCIEECETEEQMRAVTARFARNARKRKRKRDDVAEYVGRQLREADPGYSEEPARGAAHERETAEERRKRLRSEWENVTN